MMRLNENSSSDGCHDGNSNVLSNTMHKLRRAAGAGAGVITASIGVDTRHQNQQRHLLMQDDDEAEDSEMFLLGTSQKSYDSNSILTSDHKHNNSGTTMSHTSFDSCDDADSFGHSDIESASGKLDDPNGAELSDLDLKYHQLCVNRELSTLYDELQNSMHKLQHQNSEDAEGCDTAGMVEDSKAENLMNRLWNGTLGRIPIPTLVPPSPQRAVRVAPTKNGNNGSGSENDKAGDSAIPNVQTNADQPCMTSVDAPADMARNNGNNLGGNHHDNQHCNDADCNDADGHTPSTSEHTKHRMAPSRFANRSRGVQKVRSHSPSRRLHRSAHGTLPSPRKGGARPIDHHKTLHISRHRCMSQRGQRTVGLRRNRSTERSAPGNGKISSSSMSSRHSRHTSSHRRDTQPSGDKEKPRGRHRRGQATDDSKADDDHSRTRTAPRRHRSVDNVTTRTRSRSCGRYRNRSNERLYASSDKQQVTEKNASKSTKKPPLVRRRSGEFVTRSRSTASADTGAGNNQSKQHQSHDQPQRKLSKSNVSKRRQRTFSSSSETRGSGEATSPDKRPSSPPLTVFAATEDAAEAADAEKAVIDGGSVSHDHNGSRSNRSPKHRRNTRKTLDHHLGRDKKGTASGNGTGNTGSNTKDKSSEANGNDHDNNNDNDNDNDMFTIDGSIAVSFYDDSVSVGSELEEKDPPEDDNLPDVLENPSLVLLDLVNEERRNRGMVPLARSATMQECAIDHVRREAACNKVDDSFRNEASKGSNSKADRTSKYPGVLLRGSSASLKGIRAMVLEQLLSSSAAATNADTSSDGTAPFNPLFYECGVATTIDSKSGEIYACILLSGGYRLSCLF